MGTVGRALGAHGGRTGAESTKTQNPRGGEDVGGVGGLGVKTYTFLQAGRIGQGGEIGVWMGPRIRTLGRNPPHERSRGTQTTFRCGCVVQPTPKGWASSKAGLVMEVCIIRNSPVFHP